MKKSISIMSLILALTLIITTFGGTAVFADETNPTTLTFSNGFDTATTLELGTLNYYELELNKPELSVQAQSSDDTVIKAKLEKDSDNPGYYDLVLAAKSTGDATVTVTASDGTTVTRNLTVQSTGVEKNYIISSDTTKNFALPKGNSYVMKIHYESYDMDFSYPLLVTDDDSTIIKTQILYTDYNNSDYYYRVEAIGNEGETGTLYMSGSNFIPEALCTVTIAENDFLRVDTTATYVCNVNDTYPFVAYTNAATAPEVSTFNDKVSAAYFGKVPGGYAYMMTAEEEGDSVVQVTSNGETSSFAVHVNYGEQPSVKTDAPSTLTLKSGEAYTYKVRIMGGGEPVFVADTAGVISIQNAVKDGVDYYCKVTATGQPESTTSLSVTFPDSNDDSYNVKLADITIDKSLMKSDTNYDFSVKKGASYMFKITGATSFHAGSSGVFTVQLVSKSGDDSYYRITAVGAVGQQTGLYMSNGTVSQKACVVTVAPSVTMKSDTNQNFTVKQGAGYMFKITGATSFHAGSSGVFNIQLVSKSGNDSYYRIIAIGKPGQQTGLYMSASGYSQKVCVVTIAAPEPVVITSDTNYDFAIAKNSTYQFKLTAPGASSLNFTPGTSGVYSIALVKRVNNDFYYKITAIGNSGQKTGLYASVPGQDPKKICVVAVK